MNLLLSRSFLVYHHITSHRSRITVLKLVQLITIIIGLTENFKEMNLTL